jgi:hypothetical protein
VLSEVCVLSKNGGFQRKVHVHEILFQCGQHCYRNLWDVETCHWKGNAELN